MVVPVAEQEPVHREQGEVTEVVEQPAQHLLTRELEEEVVVVVPVAKLLPEVAVVVVVV
jgi:hypothetical protein